MEVTPGIHRIVFTLGQSNSRSVNCYLLQDRDGYVLVDCGWDGDDQLETLLTGLRQAGASLDDVHTLVVTHCHSDHYGMAGTLKRLGRMQLLMHPVDWQEVHSHRIDAAATARDIIAWLERNGLSTRSWPEEERRTLGFLRRFTIAPPDAELEEGDTLQVGGYRLRVLFTPGHSEGHICLYDAEHRLLLAGDHVLESVTPHIAMSSPFTGDPLGECIASLKKVEGLEVELVLPGHGAPFRDYAPRVQGLLAHHAERERLVLEGLSRGPATGVEVAGQLPWARRRTGFDQLPASLQRLALGQTLAHLLKLQVAGRVSWEEREGLVYYGLQDGLN